MRTIIAGSRTIKDFKLLKKVVDLSDFKPSEIISGGAYGVDRLGEDYARLAYIDLVVFHANWHKHGRAAGPIRNERMAQYASSDPSKPGGLICLWDGVSRGTKSMIASAVNYKLRIFIWRTDLDSQQILPTI